MSRFPIILDEEKKEGFAIDDITWNDLDMDRLYKMVNQTISSPGEDVLYDMMRRPVFSQAEIDKRDELIDFFSQHEKRTGAYAAAPVADWKNEIRFFVGYGIGS